MEMNVEEKIKEIIGDVLELDDLSVINDNTNFFELGGNSLTAMIVAEQIKDTYGCELDFTKMYESPKFSEIVNMVSVSCKNA